MDVGKLDDDLEVMLSVAYRLPKVLAGLALIRGVSTRKVSMRLLLGGAPLPVVVVVVVGAAGEAAASAADEEADWRPLASGDEVAVEVELALSPLSASRARAAGWGGTGGATSGRRATTVWLWCV